MHVNEITLLDIVNDTSTGKKISFVQLKALIMGNKKIFHVQNMDKGYVSVVSTMQHFIQEKLKEKNQQ